MAFYEKIIDSQCNKQTTVAVIMKDKKLISIGTNYVLNKQKECPRKDMPSGQGYELCKTICSQAAHAEVCVCEMGWEYCKGATLYLIGHTYACDNCISVMKKYGIKELVICDTNETIKF